MNAPTRAEFLAARQKYIGGAQSLRVPLLNEGLVRHLYGSGMNIQEVAKEIGCTARALWSFMDRCGIARRAAVKRDQCGDKNSTWRGEMVCYKAAHQRVYAARGRPSACEHCGTTDPEKRYEWANLTGRHHDPADYLRLCRSCHCKHDGLIRNLGHYAKEPPRAPR